MCCWAHTRAHTSHMWVQTTCPCHPDPFPTPPPQRARVLSAAVPWFLRKKMIVLPWTSSNHHSLPWHRYWGSETCPPAVCPCHVTAPVLTCSDTHPLSCLGTPGPTSPSCHREQCWCVQISCQDSCTKASTPCSGSRAIALQGTQRHLHGILQTFLLFSLVTSFPRHSADRRTV